MKNMEKATATKLFCQVIGFPFNSVICFDLDLKGQKSVSSLLGFKNLTTVRRAILSQSSPLALRNKDLIQGGQ